MGNIKGPITLKSGEIHDAVKEEIKKNGIKTPFGTNCKYSNSNVDSWFRLKGSDGNKYRYDRANSRWDKEI